MVNKLELQGKQRPELENSTARCVAAVRQPGN